MLSNKDCQFFEEETTTRGSTTATTEPTGSWLEYLHGDVH